ncbi:hypothetical protein GQ53DRAFT_750435 [Thozetella sp. PMI_491]|nr:hypothetical protein GQ53DRAFT_750435 [Thozetella sp. PMI_491]
MLHGKGRCIDRGSLLVCPPTVPRSALQPLGGLVACRSAEEDSKRLPTVHPKSIGDIPAWSHPSFNPRGRAAEPPRHPRSTAGQPGGTTTNTTEVQ